MKLGILIFTGQPSTQLGFAQSRQRCASRIAISFVRPLFTSSKRVVARYAASSSGICTLSIAVRSLGFISLRNTARHSALRSVSSAKSCFVSSAGLSSVVIVLISVASISIW